MYEVELSPEAADFFSQTDRRLAERLARCFERLEVDPRRGQNVKRLTADWAGYWRYRVGDWRLIYRIDDEANRVYVLLIGHRREIYD